MFSRKRKARRRPEEESTLMCPRRSKEAMWLVQCENAGEWKELTFERQRGREVDRSRRDMWPIARTSISLSEMGAIGGFSAKE